MKEAVSAARCRQPPALQGRRPSFRERGRDPPQSSSVCGDDQDSVVTADLCSTSDTHTTQKTSAMRLLMNDISATPLYGLPGPQAIGKEPGSASSKSFGRICLPSYVSLYILQNSSLNLAYCTYTTAQRSTHVRNRPHLYQLEPLLLTSAWLGNIQRKDE